MGRVVGIRKARLFMRPEGVILPAFLILLCTVVQHTCHYSADKAVTPTAS